MDCVYHPRGVYSIIDWDKTIFEIEGLSEPIDLHNRFHIKKSYLLKHNGIRVGFVYDIGLKKVT